MERESNASENCDGGEWAASSYYASSLVHCPLEDAWRSMVNYPAWNPGFVGSRVTRVQGDPNVEDEIVLIELVDGRGDPLPPFYAQTLNVVPWRRMVWYAHDARGNAFRNFISFELVPEPHGIVFSIHWYALDRLTGPSLTEHRKATELGLQQLADAFKTFVSTHARPPS